MAHAAHVRARASGTGRIAWIDLAKGLGICLMTFGHVGEAPGSIWAWALPALATPTEWVYLFHMPAFFLLGGLTYRRGQRPLPFLAKKARTLLVPYGVWSLYFPVKAAATAGGADVAAAVAASLASVVVRGEGLWFLAAYFVGELVAYVVMDVMRARGVAGCAMGVALFMASYWWYDQIALTGAADPPFQLVNGLRAAGLMCVGASLRPWLTGGGPVRRRVAACALLAAVAAFVGAGRSALAEGAPVPGWVAYALAALAGSLMLALVALLLPASAWLERVGRASLVYYVVAPEVTNLVKLPVVWALGAFGVALGPAAQWALGLAMTAAILAISRPVVALVRRLLPWSVGLVRLAGNEP